MELSSLLEQTPYLFFVVITAKLFLNPQTNSPEVFGSAFYKKRRTLFYKKGVKDFYKKRIKLLKILFDCYLEGFALFGEVGVGEYLACFVEEQRVIFVA